MDFQSLLIALLTTLDGLTQAQQEKFAHNIGEALGTLVNSSATDVDNYLILEVLAPNLKVAIKALEDAVVASE